MEDASTTKNASSMQLPDYLTNCKIYNPPSDINITVDGLVLQVLYGDKTGTAQDVAEQIWKSAQRKQKQSTVSSLDEYDRIRHAKPVFQTINCLCCRNYCTWRSSS